MRGACGFHAFYLGFAVSVRDLNVKFFTIYSDTVFFVYRDSDKMTLRPGLAYTFLLCALSQLYTRMRFCDVHPLFKTTYY